MAWRSEKSTLSSTPHMAETQTLSLLEQCRVAPPQDTAELSLPLTFFDTQWWNFSPMHQLLFFDLPHSRTHFIQNIFPKLKESLSLALKHFLPMAGNLICPSKSGRLGFCYQIGDSIPLTLAESDDDFNYLAGDHPRNSDRFYPLVPQLPPPSVDSSGKTKTPLFALQVTIFPDCGACIAWSYRHVIGDASTTVGFLKAWSSIYKCSGDSELIASNSVPSYNRTLIQDPLNLDNLVFHGMRAFKSQEPPSVTAISTVKVRATFHMSQTDLQKLKNSVLAKEPTISYLSSLTVTCAYVWTCWLRSLDATGENVDENEAQYMTCLADFRAHLDPPLPPTYFGNCLMRCIASCTYGQAVGEEGFLNAAVQIREAIQKTLNNKDAVAKGAWLSELRTVAAGRNFAVAGSPKYDAYDVDFGWGVAKKYESVTIDQTEVMTLNKSRKFGGGLEFSLSLSKKRMDAFQTIFNDGLKNL